MTLNKIPSFAFVAFLISLFNFSIGIAGGDGKLGLKDLIFEVEKEILAAQKEHKKSSSEPMFIVEKLQLKIQFQVKTSVKGGIKIWVVEAGGGAEKTSTHEITLDLQPIRAQPME